MAHPLHALVPSLSATLGIRLPGAVVDFGPAQHVVVVLIDGLGWISLNAHRELAPTLASGSVEQWLADLPTTTPTGLAALGTGLPVGEHGFVGATFALPETGDLLTPLHWPAHVPPIMVQPEPTVFEHLHAGGVSTWNIGPVQYATSGLTNAVLRGATYRGVRSIAEYGEALRAVHNRSESTFSYVYWPELDRVGHRHGVDSSEWRRAFQDVDSLIQVLVAAAHPEALILVTADHGMVDVRPIDRIDVEDVRGLRGVLRAVGGEPRFRHFYVDGDAAAIAESCRHQIGHAFDLMTRQDVIDRGIFGVVDPALRDRIGDVVAVARERWILASTSDRRVSGFIGQHGSSTAAEQFIPAAVIRP